MTITRAHCVGSTLKKKYDLRGKAGRAVRTHGEDSFALTCYSVQPLISAQVAPTIITRRKEVEKPKNKMSLQNVSVFPHILAFNVISQGCSGSATRARAFFTYGVFLGWPVDLTGTTLAAISARHDSIFVRTIRCLCKYLCTNQQELQKVRL